MASFQTSLETKTVKMPVQEVQVGMFVSELDRDWLETPFILQGFTIECAEDIETLKEYCEFVYVDKESVKVAQARQAVGKADNSRYPVRKTSKQGFTEARDLQRSGRALTRNFMDDVRLGRAIDVKEVEQTVSGCVKSIIHNPDAMMWLSKLRDKDQYTSDHSFNVGLLAINLGRHLGMSEDDLVKLGICGMLHDVGKMTIPPEILNKDSHLTNEEMRIMREHTTAGRDILMSHDNIFEGAVDVAYSHHETINGLGYPRKIKGAGISYLSKIVSICDVYDAITSDRCYKNGEPSTKALNILGRTKGEQLEDHLVEAFVECIGLYPTGSIVELQNGYIGIVTSTNYRHRFLPQVLLAKDPDHNDIDLSENRIIDLAQESKADRREFFIKQVLPNGAYDIRLEQFVERGLIIT